MEQILGVITGELETLVEARDLDTLRHKRKAITILFPYAVSREREQQYAILDVFLHAVRGTQPVRFWWRHVRPFMKVLFGGTGRVSAKWALMLASPYIPWREWSFGEGPAQAWAAAVSTVPREEEIAPSVVDALLQIASIKPLLPHIPGDAWSWLTLRPSLPPVFKGRNVGSVSYVVQMVRDLKNIEILKSYLLLIWSEWDSLYDDGYFRMRISIREDFGGIGMDYHRADLLQRLDYVPTQLDRGLEHLQRYKPSLNEVDLQGRKKQYEALKEILLDVDREALEVLTRTFPRSTALSELLTHVGVHRITFNVHVCAPYRLTLVGCLGCLIHVPLHH